MHVFWRSSVACLLAAGMMAPLSALAQTTTPYTNSSRIPGTKTVTTKKLANGNTVETTTAVGAGLASSGVFGRFTETDEVEKDRDGNTVKETSKWTETIYNDDPAKGGKQVSQSTGTITDTTNQTGGHDKVSDTAFVNNRTGETIDDHSESSVDADGKQLKGHETRTTRKPGEKPVKDEYNWDADQGWHKVSLEPPALTGGNSQKIYYYVQGRITSRDGRAGKFYSAAPKVGSTTNESGYMWLSGGVLHATGTDTPYNDYVGTLSPGGSFSVRADWSGSAATIQGTIASSGAITGTYVWPFSKGCIEHVKLAKGSHLDASWTAFGGRT